MCITEIMNLGSSKIHFSAGAHYKHVVSRFIFNKLIDKDVLQIKPTTKKFDILEKLVKPVIVNNIYE